MAKRSFWLELKRTLRTKELRRGERQGWRKIQSRRKQTGLLGNRERLDDDDGKETENKYFERNYGQRWKISRIGSMFVNVIVCVC